MCAICKFHFIFSDLIRFMYDRNVFVASTIDDDNVGHVSTRCCPAFVPPEIIHRRSKVYRAQPADVWSLGVLCFVLCTGRWPFCEERPLLLARRIRQCQFAFKPTDVVSRSGKRASGDNHKRVCACTRLFSARLLVHSILRLDPAERPSADLIAAADWLRDVTMTTATESCGGSGCNNSGGGVGGAVAAGNANGRRSVRVFVPSNVHERAAAPPPVSLPVLRLLLQPAAARNAIYASRPEFVHSMEAFFASLPRTPVSKRCVRARKLAAVVVATSERKMQTRCCCRTRRNVARRSPPPPITKCQARRAPPMRPIAICSAFSFSECRQPPAASLDLSFIAISAAAPRPQASSSSSNLIVRLKKEFYIRARSWTQ